MNENELQDALLQLIDAVTCMDDDMRDDAGLEHDLAEVKKVRTYDDVGMLTKNTGLVITTADGSEFQLTIVQSR